MTKKLKIKRELWYISFMVLVFIVGCIHIFYTTYSLYNCVGCSAPYSLAFIFPGGLYLMALGILSIIYYILRKKYRYTLGTLLVLVLLVLIIVLRAVGSM